jgi:hypothetical protein
MSVPVRCQALSRVSVEPVSSEGRAHPDVPVSRHADGVKGGNTTSDIKLCKSCVAVTDTRGGSLCAGGGGVATTQLYLLVSRRANGLRRRLRYHTRLYTLTLLYSTLLLLYSTVLDST